MASSLVVDSSRALNSIVDVASERMLDKQGKGVKDLAKLVVCAVDWSGYVQGHSPSANALAAHSTASAIRGAVSAIDAVEDSGKVVTQLSIATEQYKKMGVDDLVKLACKRAFLSLTDLISNARDVLDFYKNHIGAVSKKIVQTANRVSLAALFFGAGWRTWDNLGQYQSIREEGERLARGESQVAQRYVLAAPELAADARNRSQNIADNQKKKVAVFLELVRNVSYFALSIILIGAVMKVRMVDPSVATLICGTVGLGADLAHHFYTGYNGVISRESW